MSILNRLIQFFKFNKEYVPPEWIGKEETTMPCICGSTDFGYGTSAIWGSYMSSVTCLSCDRSVTSETDDCNTACDLAVTDWNKSIIEE